MKKIIFLSILFGTLLTFSNCKKEEKPLIPLIPSSANVTVSLRKLASEPAAINCNGLSVELHTNSLYTSKFKSVISGTSGAASFSAVPNGKYYLIAWKDVDGSNSYSENDLFGFVETPVIIEGVIKSYVIDIYVL